ncbi:monocopper oxidase-like protein sks2 [Phtheirospermum japonicum]|uniref:Monocopper oxidase-like protein sks2 n=1 Tax=Phtheirospermum japonicum TaxID=374723 RepID=A0A830D0V7_9LAMI|nr:monocopper oxidase-like protein sks2 [Phtheirospermum japonicum]GFQ07510.1 monocopper oxidase-like protein sks2 [Phtheirospermum japonicum]
MGDLYLLYWVSIGLVLGVCLGDDPFASFDFEFSYITVSPLGVPQQVTPFFCLFFFFFWYQNLLLVRFW